MTPLKSERPPLRGDIQARERSVLPRVFCVAALVATGLFVLAAVVLGARPDPARAQTAEESAAYTVTFEGNWNTDSTPGGVVGGAHFTTLIGAVHSGDVTFWKPGGMATPGVEGVAETGGTGTFESEIRNAGAAVKSAVKSGGVSATGMRTFEVKFSRTHPLLTLLSMIGPSPDWFVGVSGLSMLDESGAWLSSHEVNLFPYDAGTEDGENFSLNNASTDPRGAITSLRGQGRFSGTRMARLSFTLSAVTPPTREEGCDVSDAVDGQSLRKFVECAAESITASGTVEETSRLLEEFRDGGGDWNDGRTYLVLLTAGGGVYFHANDRELEDGDWSEFVFCEGGESVLDRQEGCFIGYEGERRGYAHPFSASHVPMARGEEFVLLGGFDKTPGREPFTGGTGGGGGCFVGGSGSGGASGLFLTALVLLLTVLLERRPVENGPLQERVFG